MATILAIETATSACSVALVVGDERSQLVEIGNNVHSKVLLSMIESVLNDHSVEISDLDGIAVGQGPGSFTGLRIGIGVAQGLAYGIGCQLYGVSSLNALAQQAAIEKGKGLFVAAIDARMGEMYCCAYLSEHSENDGLVQELKPVGLFKPSEFSLADCLQSDHSFESTLQENDVYLVGNAWQTYQQEYACDYLDLSTMSEDVIYPNALYLLPRALRDFSQDKGVDPQDFNAQYVRNDVAQKSKRKGLTFE